MSVCEHCGKEIGPESILGMCPECLIKAGLEETGTVSAAPGRVEPPPLETLREQFPQLEILEFLGRGGMGAVYKARQPQLDRVVALKILLPDIGRDPAFAERFAIEARALARLNHPNILTIHDFGQVGGLFYFVMEYVDGLNLRELLDAERVSAREALAIVPQICDALQFAHDHGIVHRDIKPENILLDRLGRVKVADFGLAKLMGGSEAAPPQGSIAASFTLTEAGRVLGTPHYMAPEQMERPLEVDHRADIYALGVVFYQMLTGELPGKTLEPPSHKVRLDVRLDEVVLRALEKLPERRYQHVSEVKTRVETIAETLGEGDSGNQTQVAPKTRKSANPLTILKIIQVLLVNKRTGRLKPKITILKIILVFLVLHAIVPIPSLPEIFILGLLGWGGYNLVQRIRRNKKPSQPLEINPSEKKSEGYQTSLSPNETICGTEKSDEPETDIRIPRGTSPVHPQKVDWWPIIQAAAWHAVLLIVLESVTISIIHYYKNMYSGLGGVLPLATRLAMSLCGFVQNFGFFLLPPLLTLDFLVCWAAQSVGGRKALRTWFWTGCAMLFLTAAMTVFLASIPLFKLVERNNPASENGSYIETGSPWGQLFYLVLPGLIGCYYLVRQHIYRARKPLQPSSIKSSEPELGKTETSSLFSDKQETLSRFSILAIAGVCVAVVTIAYWVPPLISSNLSLAIMEPNAPRPLWKLIDFSFRSNMLPFQFFAGIAITTVLGWLAVGQIQRSSRRLCGLRLAIFDGLLFPLIALDLLIYFIFYSIEKAIYPYFVWESGVTSFLWGLIPFLISASVVALVVWVDYYIAHRVWRAVKKPALPLVESIQDEFSKVLAPAPSLAETQSSPRFSRLAVAGACWAPLFFILAFLMMFVVIKVSGGHHTGPAWWQSLLRFTLLPAGLAAPFGTTILGWMAVSQIRHSAGRLYGLGLAVFDGLLFPFLTLDLLLFCFFHFLGKEIYRAFDSIPRGVAYLNLISLLSSGVAFALSAWVDYRIAHRVWRAVNQLLGQSATDSSPSGRGPSPLPAPSGGWRPVVVNFAWHTLLLILILCFFVLKVPRYVAIYTEMGTEIPWLTGQVINSSRFLIHYSILPIFPLLALDFFLCWIAQNQRGRKGLRGWSIVYVLATASVTALAFWAISLPLRTIQRETTTRTSEPLSDSEQKYQQDIGPDVAFFQSETGPDRILLKGRALAGTRLAFYLGDNPEDGWGCTLPNTTSRFSIKVEKRSNNALDCRVLDEITHTEIFSKDSIKTMSEVNLSEGTLDFAYQGLIPATRPMGVYTNRLGEWTSSSGEKQPVFVSLIPPAAYVASPGNAGAAPEEPAPDPALIEQKPELRFLVWRGQDSNRREGELDGAWHPDGSPVDVNSEDRKLLDEMGHGSIGDATDPGRYFLYLGLKHPLLDWDSTAEIQILDTTGQPFKLGPHSGAQVRPLTGGGWVACILSEDNQAKWPSQVNLRLRYTLRPWKEEKTIPSNYNTSENRMLSSLPHGVSVTSVGQDAEGDAFISVTRDLTVDPDIQCGFVAITRDGRRRMCRSQFSSQEGNFLPEKLKVETPLSQIQEFRLLSRPFREVEFKDVILKPDPRKTQKPATTEATSIPPSGVSPTTPAAPTTATTAAVASASPDDILTNSIGMKFKRIPAGSFLMGSPGGEEGRENDEGPRHKVTLSRPFYLGVYEVTQEQYEKVMGTNQSEFKGPNKPAENVSWEDAKAFCRKLSETEKREYRLPTEAEWEYACRAGTQTAYYWGDTFDERYAWCDKNSGEQTQEVGSRLPNPWGLYDMSGNVWEWCEDWKGEYGAGDQVDPRGPVSGSRRVRRGGAWRYDPENCRSAERNDNTPDHRGDRMGFRVVLVPAEDNTGTSQTSGTAQTTIPAPTNATPATAPSTSPDDILTNSIGMQLKRIPAGSFVMGAADRVVPPYEVTSHVSIPPHQVTLTQPFYLGVYEVMQEQYEKIMGTVPVKTRNPRLPIGGVTWEDAQDFCWILSNRDKTLTYRLPTEAEWEYAARAGTTTAYYWGDTFDAQYAVCGSQKVEEVGSRKPNPWGFYDMIGNMPEWCEDWFEFPDLTEERDPRGAFVGSGRVIRNGGWYTGDPKDCRVTARFTGTPTEPLCGFRVLAVPTASLSGPPVHPARRSRRSGKPFPHLYAKDEVTTNSIGMPLRRLQPGSFRMGPFEHETFQLGDKAPFRKVTLTYPFSIGIYEVTQKQYETVMGQNPSEFKGDDLPVENLTRAEAQEFCKKLSEREKTVAYRLPTESEWEYAARAGTTTVYYWGDTFDGFEGRHAWTSRNPSAWQSQKVGLRAPNPWGLYDMLGNMAEFCEDDLSDSTELSLDMVNPKGPVMSTFYVLRGGSYRDTPTGCRVSDRNTKNTGIKRSYFGFRVVAVPTGSESETSSKTERAKQP